MKNIRRIFKADLQGLFRNFFALVIAVGLCLLPAFYAWFNIYANWDPYANTGNIRIAVSNLDEGCADLDGNQANMGAEIVEQLKQKDNIGWVFTESKKDAVERVKSGDCYAAVVIGKDFSYSMYHALADNIENPKITYYENEKKNVRWVFLFGTLMFFVGCAVGYFLVFPMTLRFLATYELSAMITEQVSLDSYMDNFLMLIFVMGIVFEMPLLSWLLSQLGLLNRSFFHKYRRHAVVGLLVASAFITPSGDPFTLSVVFFPLYGLYELSAFFVKKAPVEEEEVAEA